MVYMRDKATIRQQGKQARAALDPAVRAEYDARIIERCKSDLDWNDYERVMVFLPIERQHEINTWPLVKWIWATWPAVEVYVPRVVGAKMEAVRITPLTQYSISNYGIAEPAEGDALGGEPLDLILVPLLGFDSRGHRVGYGKGYYDGFLAAHPAAERVGLGYECLRVADGIKSEFQDVRLHQVISE